MTAPQCEVIADVEVISWPIRGELHLNHGMVTAAHLGAVAVAGYEGAEEAGVVRSVVFTPDDHPVQLTGRQLLGRALGRPRSSPLAPGLKVTSAWNL